MVHTSSFEPIADKSAPTEDPLRRGHRALRQWRASIPNRTYFITACTDNRTRLFETADIAILLLAHLRELESVDLVASVVMPDHVHAVFTLRAEATLAFAMKCFRGRSAQAINRHLNRNGPVWQRGYFDRLLRVDESLRPILHYMWCNPTPPGANFRCRHDIWAWFRTCVNERPAYYEWLERNP